MICVIAPNEKLARRWADSQNLESSEWFFATDERMLINRINFHTVVACEFPEDKLWLFERLYAAARRQGLIGRK